VTYVPVSPLTCVLNPLGIANDWYEDTKYPLYQPRGLKDTIVAGEIWPPPSRPN
ncbi:hypothetical protein BB559_006359, partial [Furculomyces boomerangus]